MVLVRWAEGFREDGVDGVRELLAEPRCGRGGGFSAIMPLRMEGFEGVREDGTEDSEPCLCNLPFDVPEVPLVDGR